MKLAPVAILLFINGVLCNFTVSFTPTSIIECQELQISWAAGDGALTFWSTPDILANNATVPIIDLGEQSSPFNWPAVNITSGTAVTIIIQNSTSDLSSTSGDTSFVVGTGSDTSCLSQATSSDSTSFTMSRTRISSSTSTSIGRHNENGVTSATTQTGVSRIILIESVLIAIVGTTLIILLIHTVLRYRKQRAKHRPSDSAERIDPFMDLPRGDEVPPTRGAAESDKGPGESESVSVLAMAGSFLTRISTMRSTNTDSKSTRLTPPPKKKSRRERGHRSTETMNPIVDDTEQPPREVSARDGGEGQGQGYDIQYLVREMARLKARLDELTEAQGNAGSSNRTENSSENISTKPPTYRSRTAGSEQ